MKIGEYDLLSPFQREVLELLRKIAAHIENIDEDDNE